LHKVLKIFNPIFLEAIDNGFSMRTLPKFNSTENAIRNAFFKSYPQYHILKLFIRLQLNRHISHLFFKFLYWIWFKIINRIQIIDVDKVRTLRTPFLVVQNHCSYNDAIMQLAVFAHMGYYLHTFTMENSFTREAFECIFAHFIEMIPRYGTGESCVNRMVSRLIRGGNVSIFPAGTYPSGKYANTGFVQEAYTGAARAAYKYKVTTDQPLIIQPVCSLGANSAYPPKKGDIKGKITSKIFIKFGEPFTLAYTQNPSNGEFREKSAEIQMKIASLWGQKKLIPNLGRQKISSIHELNTTFRIYGKKKT